MTRLISDISISLDGFAAGPNPNLEQPLGEGGDLLHEWALAAASWRESHGLEGGEENADSEVIEEWIRATGAVVMGRKMFSGGEGPLGGRSAGQTAGGATILRSTCRCSCSPITFARRRSCRAVRRSSS
jgi:hypothetical protein